MHDQTGVAGPVRFVARVEPTADHAVNGPFARAGLIPAHVEKDPVDRAELAQHFIDLAGQVILVGARHVQDLPAWREGRATALDVAQIGGEGDPLRVGVGGVLVALHADVDRRPDAGAVQRFYLFAQQIQVLGQRRVAGRVIGVEVEMPMVAFGEHRHAVDVRFLECACEIGSVEIAGHVRDRWAGVEVQVDGAQGKGEIFGHDSSLSLCRMRIDTSCSGGRVQRIHPSSTASGTSSFSRRLARKAWVAVHAPGWHAASTRVASRFSSRTMTPRPSSAGLACLSITPSPEEDWHGAGSPPVCGRS